MRSVSHFKENSPLSELWRMSIGSAVTEGKPSDGSFILKEARSGPDRVIDSMVMGVLGVSEFVGNIVLFLKLSIRLRLLG